MALSKFYPAKSEGIIRAAYDAETQTMQIEFTERVKDYVGTYEYSNVSPELWKDFELTFQSDESTGTFFKNNFLHCPFQRVSK